MNCAWESMRSPKLAFSENNKTKDTDRHKLNSYHWFEFEYALCTLTCTVPMNHIKADHQSQAWAPTDDPWSQEWALGRLYHIVIKSPGTICSEGSVVSTKECLVRKKCGLCSCSIPRSGGFELLCYEQSILLCSVMLRIPRKRIRRRIKSCFYVLKGKVGEHVWSTR